ncbi:hypothetical protein FQA39_LY13159 [Lamprigera yunnana]|nr:hypothetical protein FQA39_LY13159 [Lamprigera yunnana]
MWMAYAEPYWTRAVDLRSAVERECEQMQDKYENGRKICTKFMQGIYCASCLIVHLKKAGLEQFVDRIKEHIKDYSDSDTLSDDGCEEDDNKHANTAKEEEQKE